MKTGKLEVLYYNGSTYTDYSDEAFSYHRDTFSSNLTTSQDYLYIGYYKPINSLYAEFEAYNTTSASMTLEFYNGTTWGSVTDLLDDTKGFKRSGFVTWDRNQTDEAKTTINSSEKYWVRISFDATLSAGTSIKGLNLVLSDDQDLKEEWFEVDEFIPETAESFILKHVAARNEIIQKLRNDGKYKIDVSAGNYRDIDVWDLLDFDQLRQASKYLTLSKICFDLFNEPEDTFYVKYEDYRSKYKEAVDLFYLNLDNDDDGIEDKHEQLQSVGGLKLVRR